MILSDKNIQPDARALSLLIGGGGAACCECVDTDNIFCGTGAGENVVAADGNVGIGRDALNDITNQAYNVAIGYYAGAQNTGGSNVHICYFAGYQCDGYYNVMIGYSAGYGNGASYNAEENVFIGGNSGYNIDDGDTNTAVGYGSMQGAAVGGIDGDYNCAFGTGSLSGISTGGSNTALGPNAGNTITTGSYNVMIGDAANPSAAGASNELNIDDLIYGEFDNDNVGLNTRTYGGGTGVLSIADTASAPAGAHAGVSIFYSSGGEMYAQDDAGNSTQLTSHIDDEWVHHDIRPDGREYVVWMEQLVRAVEELTGKEFSEWRNTESRG